MATKIPDEDHRWSLLALDHRERAYYADDPDDVTGVAVYADADWKQ